MSYRPYIYKKEHDENDFFSHLISNLTVPSVVHTFSMITEYTRNWFLSHFNDDYFGKNNQNIYIEGRHPYAEFRNFNNKEMLKKMKPNLSISPKISFEYDRDKSDMKFGRNKLFFNVGNLDKSFYRDFENKKFLGLDLELLEFTYDFKIRVSTRAEQIDIFKMMKINFGVGFTQTNYLDLDYHIPYSIMLQIAYDNGFKIENKKIIDVDGLLAYMNKRSQAPILYKLRNINGNFEFFIRYRGVPVHFNLQDDINPDAGDMDGMVPNNFILDWTVVIRVPSPRVFMYYTEKEKSIYIEASELTDMNNGLFISKIKPYKELDVNSKGWNRYLTTEYQIEKPGVEKLSMDFTDLFEQSDIQKIIDYNNSINVSSDIFIEFMLYNSEGESIPYTMDWTTNTLYTDYIGPERIIPISIYIDTVYRTNYLITKEKIDEKRYQ